MDKQAFTAILLLAVGAARADRGTLAMADSAQRRPPVVDLDLSLGDEEDPAPVPAMASAPQRNWYYWAAAGAALAAGGAGLYWYEDRARSPGAPVRNEQVFTDEP